MGRISRSHDLAAIRKYDGARVIAVCDLDANRVEEGKKLVNGFYSTGGKPYNGVVGYRDYHELLANKEIDAVVISTPDHQHAVVAVAAVRAGKDVYLQKPASLTIAEGRYMADAITASGRIFQIGSQQRSWKQFHRALRTGAQRPHRRRAARGSRTTGRSIGAGCAGDAGAARI